MNDLLKRLQAFRRSAFFGECATDAITEIERLSNQLANVERVRDEWCNEYTAARNQLETANRSLALQVSRRSKECALLKAIVDTNSEFRAGMPDEWEGDPLQDAIDAASKHLTDDLGGQK